MKTSIKTLGSQRKGKDSTQLKSQVRQTRASCNPKGTQIHFITCQLIIRNKPRFLSTCFRILLLNDWIDNIQAQRSGLRHNTKKSYPSGRKDMLKAKMKVTWDGKNHTRQESIPISQNLTHVIMSHEKAKIKVTSYEKILKGG